MQDGAGGLVSQLGKQPNYYRGDTGVLAWPHGFTLPGWSDVKEKAYFCRCQKPPSRRREHTCVVFFQAQRRDTWVKQAGGTQQHLLQGDICGPFMFVFHQFQLHHEPGFSSDFFPPVDQCPNYQCLLVIILCSFHFISPKQPSSWNVFLSFIPELKWHIMAWLPNVIIFNQDWPARRILCLSKTVLQRTAITELLAPVWLWRLAWEEEKELQTKQGGKMCDFYCWWNERRCWPTKPGALIIPDVRSCQTIILYLFSSHKAALGITQLEGPHF